MQYISINKDSTAMTLRERYSEIKSSKRALLTEEHVKNRLIWARKHQHWTLQDWAKVIWSDESAVKKGSDTRTVWV